MWFTLLELLPCYARHKQRGDVERAEKLKTALCRMSFSSVLDCLLRVADSEVAAVLLPEECRVALKQCPEIRE